MKTFITVLVLAAAAHAQPFGFGVKGGAPLNEAFDVANGRKPFSDTTRFIVGGMAELRLPLGFAVEGDILYTRFHFSSDNLLASIPRSSSNAWEFPIVVKYKFSGLGPVRPYVEAGPNFRKIQSVLRVLPKQINDDTGKGIVFGAGVELKLLFVRISPELRYTHWGTQRFLDAANVPFSTVQSQGQFLVGFSF